MSDLKEHALTCPDCSAPMKLRPSRYGLFYGCSNYPKCKGTHGAHPDGSPLGVPATKAVKEARIRAHDAFDRLWRSRGWRRNSAYHWLARSMGLANSECHIGMFDLARCEMVVAICHDEEERPMEQRARIRKPGESRRAFLDELAKEKAPVSAGATTERGNEQ